GRPSDGITVSLPLATLAVHVPALEASVISMSVDFLFVECQKREVAAPSPFRSSEPTFPLQSRSKPSQIVLFPEPFSPKMITTDLPDSNLSSNDRVAPRSASSRNEERRAIDHSVEGFAFGFPPSI